VGRLETLRANVRRAYEVSRDTVRAARARPEPNGAPQPLAVVDDPAAEDAPPPPPPPPAPFDETVPRSLRIAAAWSWRLIVVAGVGWGLLWIVDRFLILVAPLMIALLLTGLLAPAQRRLQALRLNRSFATFLVLVGGLAAVVGTITLAANQVIQGIDDLVASAEEGIVDIQNWLQGPPLQMSDTDFQDLAEQGRTWVEDNTETLTTAGLSAVTGTFHFLTGFLITLFATFFLLRDGRQIWTFLVGLLPTRARAPMTYAGDGAWRSLSGYVRATVLVAFIDAVGIGIGLWVLRVPLVVPLAALVFLGAFVPMIGAFISGTIAVLVALVDAPGDGVLDGGGPIKALMVLGLILLVQQVEGHLLLPLIISRAVKIHPLAVIIAVTAGTLLAGIIGALVAVPIVAVLNAVVRRLNRYHQLSAPALETAAPEPAERPLDDVGVDRVPERR
jgi:putative heme transporter